MKKPLKNSENTAISFYNQLGVKTLKCFGSPKRTITDLAFIEKLLKKTDSVLDLACGYGRITIPLYHSGFSIQGVDIAPNLITDARKTAKNLKLPIKFKVGSMLALPYESESFDKIICLWTSFNHLLTPKDQLNAINEMHRVLKHGGISFIDIVDGERKSIVNTLNKIGQGHNKRILTSTPYGITNYDYQHSRQTITDLCNQSLFNKYKVGFKIISRKRRIFATLYKN